jgi:hypothetical protein
MMSEQKRYMAADEIRFVIDDLRGIMTTIAGHIQIKLRNQESVLELRQHTTKIAGSIAQMNHKMRHIEDCKGRDAGISRLKKCGVGGAN